MEQKTRRKSASNLQEPSEVDDNESMENHTNLNWETGAGHGKKRKLNHSEYTFIDGGAPSIVIQGGPKQNEVETLEFYQSSHYFIDELKGEFCKVQVDGWFEVKAKGEGEEERSSTLPDLTSPKETPDESEELGVFNSGKWSDLEHQKFLEGLRLFGKDWSRVQSHIGTRSIKSIVSHAQKFLIRLVKFLAAREDSQSPIEEMSSEDAEFFYGILQKRVSWMAKMKEERDKEKKELKLQGKLFHVQKIDRRPPKKPVSPPNRMEPPKPKQIFEITREEPQYPQQSQFEAWKAKVFGDDSLSAAKSLGFSIKIGTQSETKVTFKADIVIEDEDSEDDSGISQSSEHTRKFHLEEGFEPLLSNLDLLMAFQGMMHDQFKELPDISPEEDNVHLMIKMLPDGPLFDIFEEQSPSDIVQGLYKQRENEMFSATHPNLSAYFKREMNNLLHEKGLMDGEEPSPLKLYFRSLDKEQLQSIIDNGFKVYLEKKKPNDGLEAQMEEMNLDLVTNFAHLS